MKRITEEYKRWINTDDDDDDEDEREISGVKLRSVMVKHVMISTKLDVHYNTLIRETDENENKN